MKRFPVIFLVVVAVFLSVSLYAQTSARAKELYIKAMQDSALRNYFEAANAFDLAAGEEMKAKTPSWTFSANCYLRAAGLYKQVAKYAKSNDAYYLAIEANRKAGNQRQVFSILKSIGDLYTSTAQLNVAYDFPKTGKLETINANRTINSLSKKSDNSYEAIIDGGSNDGLYEGADADVYGRHRQQGEDRANRLLGHAKVTSVFPNYSRVLINLINPADSFYQVYPLDMVSAPIRFPNQRFKNVFLEVSLLNIKFVDNARETLAHQRTLMYYYTPALETEMYDNMLANVKEIYDMIKDDKNYDPTETITRGRFKGITWKEAMNRSTAADIRAFLGFVRSYPGKYMGGVWKISETYATWLLNNAPPGSNEMMDSLLVASSELQFNYFLKTYERDIRNNLFETWQIDVQNMGLSGKVEEAFKWNRILQRVGSYYKDNNMLGWTYFNVGRIQDEQKKYDEAIEAYKQGKTYFEMGDDARGLGFCINNLGSIYSSKYLYKESQQMYENVLKLRLAKLVTDTSEDQKITVARSYRGVGDALYNQSLFKEAIEQYQKGLALLDGARSVEGKTQIASLSRMTGKAYQQMSDYLVASGYYEREFQIQKGLGDLGAQADALDNKAYLLSLVGKNRESLEAYLSAYKYHLNSGEKNDAAFTMSNIGQVLWTLGKFDSAIVAHNQSISISQETGNKKAEANSWKKIGGLYKESGNAIKSMDAYQKTLAIYKQMDTQSEYGELLEDLASSFMKVKDYQLGEKYYNEALEVYKSVKKRNKEAAVLSSLGDAYYTDLKYDKAETYYVRAGEIQKEINDRSGLMYTFTNRSNVAQYAREDYRDAINKIREAYRLSKETGSENYMAFCENKIGMLYSFLNEYDSALYYYDRSYQGYLTLEDKENQSMLLVNYGYYYNYRGDFEKARSYFEKALTIAKEINNAYSIASAIHGLTGYHYTSGNFPEAIKGINEVLKIYQEKENPWGIAAVYLEQGNIRGQQGEFDEALEYYYKTDSLYKKLSLEKPRISVTNNIGTVYYQQKNYELALKQFDQTKRMLEKNNDDPAFIALIKSNIGEVLVDQKKYKEAEPLLVESLKLASKQKNIRQLYISNMIYGRLLTDMKRYVEAGVHFSAADSLLSKGGEKTQLIQLLESWGRLLFLENKNDLAEKKLLDCVKMSEEIQYRYYSWKALSTLADIKFAVNKPEAGIDYLKSALTEIELIKSKISGAESKKIFSSDETVVELYQKMVVYLKKQGRAEEALVYMEKANAENIRLRLNDAGINYKDEETNMALAKEKELRKQQAIIEKQIAAEKSKPEQIQHKEQIAQWEKMRSVTAEQYKSYINELKIKYPNLQAFKTVDPTDFLAQRRKIPADVAVVSYLVTDKEMSVFVVMKDTVFVKDIPLDRDVLQKKIRRFYALHARSGKSVDDARGGKLGSAPKPAGKETKEELAEELYDLLVAPLMKDIGAKQRVAIVPSGFLCFVPFDALVSREANGGRMYFGEQKQLFYVNKISTVTGGDEQKMDAFKVIAVGNADKSLPNAEIEVNSLKAKLPNTVVYTRDQATKKNVLRNKGDFNVLHLATHGILDYGNADSSYLVLASDPDNKDDGRLTIRQIQEMTDIDRFRMVTLSACETAVIREVAEGWPISTASAFIEMGVPTVIATLWQVDDKATRLLVDRFYENLQSMDKVQALQQAQLYLKKQAGYEDPYYWAPFQLVGFWK